MTAQAHTAMTDNIRKAVKFDGHTVPIDAHAAEV